MSAITSLNFLNGIGPSYPYVFNAKYSNTVGLRSAIFGAINRTARKRVLFCGDSTQTGVGSSPGTSNLNASWPLAPAAQLRTLLNNGGVPTNINTFMGGTSATDMANYKLFDTRISTTVWTFPAITTHSIGGKIYQHGTAAGQMNFTPGGGYAFENAELLCLDPALTRSILVRANGGTVATISNVGIANTPRLVTVTGISPAITVLGFQPGTSAVVFIVGGGAYQTGETAMAFYQAGWGGSVAADWDDTALIYSAVNAIPVLAPAHTFLEITINDENAPTNLTLYGTYMQALVTAALLSGSVTLVVGGPSAPNPPEATHSSLATQMTFWKALYDLASLNDVSLLDLTVGIGSYANMDAAGYMSDVSHLTAAGYAFKASIYYNFFRQVAALGV